MILVALGSNVSGPWGNPRETVLRAVQELDHMPLQLIKVSTLIDTAPFGNIEQPHFVNAVAIIATKLNSENLLRHLHDIEKRADRVRSLHWGPRTLDLDILDFNGMIQNQNKSQNENLVLPHPGIADRSFVLEPIVEIAPEWRHPLTNLSAQSMIQKL